MQEEEQTPHRVQLLTSEEGLLLGRSLLATHQCLAVLAQKIEPEQGEAYKFLNAAADHLEKFVNKMGERVKR